jgi:ABC-type branched-subunit amino acid transport system substrate-binding protein
VRKSSIASILRRDGGRLAKGVVSLFACFAVGLLGARSEAQAQGAEKESGSYANTPEILVPFGSLEPPYRVIFSEPPIFRGGGHQKPEPQGLETVKIGLLVPLHGTREDHEGQSLQRGVDLAFEEANAGGGYEGIPFEVIAKNDADAWGASSNTLAEFAYLHRVWAVIGSIDSNSTHVAIRTALKAELPVVTVGSNDPTITETGIPWVLRMTPSDRHLGYRLALYLFRERKLSRVTLLRSSDRYGRFGVKEFMDAARRLKQPIPMEILLKPNLEDYSGVLDRVENSNAEAIVLWTRAEEAARVVRQIRERGMEQMVVGTTRMVDRRFLEQAGKAAEGVQAAFWVDMDREDAVWLEFKKRFERRYHELPEIWAAYGYDAANLVIRAIHKTGLNRARILDEMIMEERFEGVTGDIVLDVNFSNIAPLVMVEVENGRFVYK